jgi:hypothetical protein
MDMGKETHLAPNGLNAGGSVEACPEDTTPNMGQAPGVVETSLTSRYCSLVLGEMLCVTGSLQKP